MSIEALQASMPQSLAHFFAMGVPGVLLEADGRVFHNAGATEAQELGIMLASAVSHLRLFEEARQPLVYAAPHIGFALSVDQDQFLSMAKIRALRRLWARVQEACSIPPPPATIHAETSFRMMTAQGPGNQHPAHRRSPALRRRPAAPIRSPSCRTRSRMACRTLCPPRRPQHAADPGR